MIIIKRSSRKTMECKNNHKNMLEVIFDFKCFNFYLRKIAAAREK